VCVENGACSGSCEEANWCTSPTPTPSPATATEYNITAASGNSGASTSTLACNQIAGDAVFFAQSGVPSNGNYAYSNSSLSSAFVGDDNWFGIDTDDDGAPNWVYQISSTGYLSNKTECTT